jgi:hypothetical protein
LKDLALSKRKHQNIPQTSWAGKRSSDSFLSHAEVFFGMIDFQGCSRIMSH